MGILNLLGNELTTTLATNPKAKKEPVVTLVSRYGIMPKSGKKLILAGYKLQNTTCDRYGNYTWIFVPQSQE